MAIVQQTLEHITLFTLNISLFHGNLLTVAFATMIGWAYLHISTSKDFGAAMRNYYQSK